MNKADLLKIIEDQFNKQTRLLIKPIDGRLQLCDEDGKPLPAQGSVKLRNVAGEFSTITVEFVIVKGKVDFWGEDNE